MPSMGRAASPSDTKPHRVATADMYSTPCKVPEGNSFSNSEWIRIPVPAIVDPTLFDAVQEQLCENLRRSRERARGARYLLQGLLVCRSCGYAYCGKVLSTHLAGGERREYTYYRCCGSDAHRFGGRHVCTNTQLRTDVLDAAVWQEVEHVLRDPARIAAEYERRLEAARRSDTGG